MQDETNVTSAQWGPSTQGLCHVSELIGVPGRLHAGIATRGLQTRSVMNNASIRAPKHFSAVKTMVLKKYA